MRTFNTPAQASAFETKYMMRPFTWPPTTHDAPTLWERAKAMFSALTTRFGSAMRVAFRRFLSSQQRRDLILHLEPVEKLVRVLMIVEAITLLVTTPIGLKLRQTTKPCRIPDPPPQVGAHKPHPEANRVQAAMMTIAAHQPRIDPRVAEREAREKEQARVAALQLQRQRFDDYDPAALTSRFSVIHWAHDPAMRTAPSTLPRSLILDDLTGPLLPLARRIASIPREHFEAPWPRRYRAVRWAHRCREFYNACILAKPAFAALDRAYGKPPQDPG
jgi:hypothetical protein